jgi:putative DNA primase/helicase
MFKCYPKRYPKQKMGYSLNCNQLYLADTFLENGRDPSQEMARLSGVRMALASEVSNRGQLNTTLTKAVTGDASIPARKLYKDTFEYDPQFKIMIACNDTPSVPCNDFAVWRRIKLIPFNLRVENVEKSLSRKLLAESAGILTWAVKGSLAWQKLGGLGNSLAIEDATSKCKVRSDKLQQFLNECVEKDEKKFITSAALFAEFN